MISQETGTRTTIVKILLLNAQYKPALYSPVYQPYNCYQHDQEAPPPQQEEHLQQGGHDGRDQDRAGYQPYH